MGKKKDKGHRYSEQELYTLTPARLKEYLKAEYERYGRWYNSHVCECCNELRFDSKEEMIKFTDKRKNWSGYIFSIKSIKELTKKFTNIKK